MDMYKEKQPEQKATDADYDYLIRCFKKNESLTGDALKLALSLIDVKGDKELSRFFGNISTKIRTEQPLSEYERQIMIDVVSNRDYEEKRKERKSRGASYGHVKRRLSNNEPLTGKTLELALELVNVHGDDKYSRFVRNIGVKMQAGKPLDEYEYHIVVDVLMVHARIGG